jgi:hypothetical protein
MFEAGVTSTVDPVCFAQSSAAAFSAFVSAVPDDPNKMVRCAGGRFAGGVQELPAEPPEDDALPDADMLPEAPELIDPAALLDAPELIAAEEEAALPDEEEAPPALDVIAADVVPGVDEGVPVEPLLPHAALISSTAPEMAASAILVVRCGAIPIAPCS